MDDIGSFIIAQAAAPPAEMTGSLSGLVLFVAIAISISFFCSMLEAAFFSTPPSYIETQAQDGTRASRWFQKAKEDVDEPIAAILTLNTFANTVGAAGAGAQAVAVFGSQWAALFTFALTFAILIFSEIIPKTLGAVYWKELFTFNAYSLRLLTFLLAPVVRAFKALTRTITPTEKALTITRDEFEMMAHISNEEGSLEENEHRILKNLLHLDRVQVGDIMTPRTVMMAFAQDTTVGDVMRSTKAIPYSRIPVYNDHIDDILGFVLRHDILQAAAEDRHSATLQDMVRQMHVVPETLAVTKAMDEFMSRKQHIFLVIDEYGGTAGIISLEDVVESLLGVEITDESDIAADLRLLAQQRANHQRMLQEAAGSADHTPALRESPD